MYRKKAP